MNNLIVKREPDGYWSVTGDGINAEVRGSEKYGPNGFVGGKGARNHRKAILEAVEAFRKAANS